MASLAPALTFNLCPEYDLLVSYRRRGISSPGSGGFVQSRTLWTEGDLRTFKLRWTSASYAEVQGLRELWRLARGSVCSMDFTPPDGTLTRVRFGGDTLVVRPRTAVAWDMNVTLEEIR